MRCDMTTLYELQSIANSDKFKISLSIGMILEELESARTLGDELGVQILEKGLKMLLEQIEPIEE